MHSCVWSIDRSVIMSLPLHLEPFVTQGGSSAGTGATHWQTARTLQNKVNTSTWNEAVSTHTHTHTHDVWCVCSLCRRWRPWAGEHGGLLAGFYRQGDHADLLWCHPAASWAQPACNQTAGNWHRWHRHYIMAPLSPTTIHM